MAEMMEEVMDVVYEHLSPAEIDAYHKEIVHLPDVLMAREDDTLEGITIGKLLLSGTEPEQGLLIATNFRIVLLRVNLWGVGEGWNASYSGIMPVNYSDGLLKIRRIGAEKSSEFELCAEKSPEHFLNILHQRVSVRYDDIMKKVMSVVHEQLAPSEIDAHHEEIMYLPEVLMSRDGIETLEGVIITVARASFSSLALLIATDIRLIEVSVQDKKAKVSWDALYSEIETVDYSHGHVNYFHGTLKIRKKKGWIKTNQFSLRSEKSSKSSEFLNTLRRHISIPVDESPLAKLANEIELADDTTLEDDVVSDKAVAIARALRSLSIAETRSLTRDEVKELPNILSEDELPEAIISGTYHDSNVILVATNRRLIFVDEYIDIVKEFYFEDISSIGTHQGWMLGSIYIRPRYLDDKVDKLIAMDRDNPAMRGLVRSLLLDNWGVVNIDNISKEMVKPFADFLSSKLDIHDAVLEQDKSAADEQPKEEQQNSPPVVQSDVSVADELRKFAELRDLGIITDEEFEAQKAKLLGM